MNRAFRIAAFLSLLALVAAACGSRVVPLEVGAVGPGNQPLVNPTTGEPINPSVLPTGGSTGGPNSRPTGPGPIGSNANCRGGATDRGVTANRIKIGLVAAKTGSFPGQFDPNIEAVDAYFKMINAAGGICGRLIELHIRDDGGNRSADETRALELAREVGVFAFVGSISAPDSDGGVSKVARQFRMPDIGFPLSYERAESPLTYGVPGQLQRHLIGEGASGSAYLNRVHGIKQIAILWVGESLVSKANAWAFEAAMLMSSEDNPSGQVEICFEQETNVFDNNFDTYASRMKGTCPRSNGPLAVYSTMENSNNVKLAQAMRRQNVEYEFFSPTFTSYLPSFVLDESGRPRPETEGAYIAMPQIPFERCAGFDSRRRPLPPCGHPELDRYIRALRRFVPNFKVPGSFGAPGWGQAALFVEAASACGANLTRACVLQQLESMGPFSANGFLSPTRPRDRVIYTADLIVQVRNGRFVEIRPGAKGGPPQAPDFWDASRLINWWDYFCAHKDLFPRRDEIDQFVTTC